MRARVGAVSLFTVVALSGCGSSPELLHGAAKGDSYEVGVHDGKGGSVEHCLRTVDVVDSVRSADLPSSSQVWTLDTTTTEAAAREAADCIRDAVDGGKVTTYVPSS